MSELHRNTIVSAMRNIMTVFSKDPLAGEFYLAGGTALALQLGHRLSVDLDFFSPTQSDIPAMLEPLRYALRDFSPVLPDSSWAILFFLQTMCELVFMDMAIPWLRRWWKPKLAGLPASPILP